MIGIDDATKDDSEQAGSMYALHSITTALWTGGRPSAAGCISSRHPAAIQGIRPIVECAGG